jgi:hypothetical protein
VAFDANLKLALSITSEFVINNCCIKVSSLSPLNFHPSTKKKYDLQLLSNFTVPINTCSVWRVNKFIAAMGKLDVSKIQEIYENVLQLLEQGTAVFKASIKATITTCLGGLDLGIIGWIVSWAAGKVIDAVLNLEAKALSIALRGEYMYRLKKMSLDNAKKAWNLTNKCSMCRCIGHNKQNHDSDLDAFLAMNRLGSYLKDAEELADVTVEIDASDMI